MRVGVLQELVRALLELGHHRRASSRSCNCSAHLHSFKKLVQACFDLALALLLALLHLQRFLAGHRDGGSLIRHRSGDNNFN